MSNPSVPEPTAPDFAAVPSQDPSAGPRRVLLVDDDDLLRKALERMLARAGWTVDARARCPDPETLLAQGYDVVVTDIVMPERDGLEWMRDWRRLPVRPPLVAISGGGRGDKCLYLGLARILGAHATLQKPFSSADLLAAVDEARAAGRASAGLSGGPAAAA